jgi:bacterioferritin
VHAGNGFGALRVEPRRKHMNEVAARADIMADESADKRLQILDLLERAYWMEIETVMSYMSASVNPDGVRAQEIKESLSGDIQEELGHAERFAQRIKELYGVVPARRSSAPSSPICSLPSTRRTSCTSSRA